MSLAFNKAMIIAKREYLTTVKRKAFIVSILLTPAILFLSGFLSTKMASDDFRKRFAEARIVAIVDSSGIYQNAPLSYDYQPLSTNPQPAATTPAAPARIVPVIMRPYPSQAVALDSLKAGHVRQALVVSADFAQTGRLRLYSNDTRVFTSSSDDRPLRFWLARNLLAGHTEPALIEGALRLDRPMPLFTPSRVGEWAVKDDSREFVGFLLPFGLAFLLSMAIMSGGQYLLQGVSEEKESRILESLLCNVTADELLLGKLVGLGAAGMTLVGVWMVAGAFAAAPVLASMNVSLPPIVIFSAIAYFLLGYLFYASILTGIGAMMSNLRETTQFSTVLTMMNFVPFWMLIKILNSPNDALAVGLSMFPPCAATTMMLRLSAASVSGAKIPGWEIALSLGLLAISAIVALAIGSRLFRLGMLLYGKSPNLPEILRILRQA